MANTYKRPGVVVKEEYLPLPTKTKPMPVMPALIFGVSRPVFEGAAAQVPYGYTPDQSLTTTYPNITPYDVVEIDSVHVFLVQKGYTFNGRSQTNRYLNSLGLPGVKTTWNSSVAADITHDPAVTITADSVTVGKGLTLDSVLAQNMYDLYIEYSAIRRSYAPTTMTIVPDGKTQTFYLGYPIQPSSDGQQDVIITEEFHLYRESGQTLPSGYDGFYIATNGSQSGTTAISVAFTTGAVAAFGSFPAEAYIQVTNQATNEVYKGVVGNNTIILPIEYSPSSMPPLSVKLMVPVDETKYSVAYTTGAIMFNTTLPSSGTYQVECSLVNTAFNQATQVNSTADIINNYGAIHPANPLAYGLYMALKEANGKGPILGWSVESAYFDKLPAGSSISKYPAEAPSIQSLMEAMDASFAINAYAIAVMYGMSFNETIAYTNNGVTTTQVTNSIRQLVTAHIQASEDPSIGNTKRIAMLSFRDFNEVLSACGSGGTNAKDYYTNPKYASSSYQTIIQYVSDPNYVSPRIRFAFPPIILTTDYITGDTMPVAGYYQTAAYAGLVQSLNNQATPLTHYQWDSITGIRYPNGQSSFYSATSLDKMAAAGIWVHAWDPQSNSVIVWDQVTTDTSRIEKSQDSMIRSADYVAIDLHNTFKPKMGRVNITPEFIQNATVLAQSKLSGYVNDEIIGSTSKMTYFGQDPKDPMGILMSVDLDLLYPAARMTITLYIK